MENLASPKVIKEIIERYGFKFSKGLGQNFLIDSNIVNKIVDFAEVTDQDYVIEIGPGIGTLTQVLCQRAKKVVSIEIDSRLIPILSENLNEYSNFKVINDDVLKVDINKIIEEEFDGKAAKVVANLPYYVTTPIIMGLLEKKLNIAGITIMIQKEVAQRVAAKPGSKDYGALSIAVQYYSSPQIGFVVSHNCFMPPPNVESIVIRLDILSEPLVKVVNEKTFFNVIKAAFGQRRKTLINSLVNSGYFNLSKEQTKQLLEELGLSENCRGETLTIEQFSQLANKLSK